MEWLVEGFIAAAIVICVAAIVMVWPRFRGHEKALKEVLEAATEQPERERKHEPIEKDDKSERRRTPKRTGRPIPKNPPAEESASTVDPTFRRPIDGAKTNISWKGRRGGKGGKT